MKIYIENYNPIKLIKKFDKLDTYFLSKKDIVEIYCDEGIYLIDHNNCYKRIISNENVVNKSLNGVNYIIDETDIKNTDVSQIPPDHISINITKFYFGLPNANNLKNQNQNLINLVIEGVKNMKPNYDNNYDTQNKYENFLPNNFYFEVFYTENIDVILHKEILNVFLSLLN
uniref:Uncharacterized protein n=1 Tax=viral metagenome TaxID=1070528 RepID=A0A6C0IFC7_9ZZZZ